MNQYKTCTKCGQTLSLDSFYRDKQKLSGFRPDCKQCVLARVKIYSDKNATVLAKKSNDWYYQNKPRASAKQKEYRIINAERLRLYFRTYNLVHKEDRSKWLKVYYSQNKHKYLHLGKERRARVRNATIYLVTSKDIKKILSLPCTYCGAKSAHVDHVIPLVKGGSHSIGNLTGACARCNLSKGSKFVMEWKRGRK